MILLYWLSLTICGIVLIPLLSNADFYLDEVLNNNEWGAYNTPAWRKWIIVSLIIASFFPVLNTLLAIYIIYNVCQLLF